MVYARYIKRDGKTLGPYYYESVKGKDGKIKSIYLGREPPVKKEKEEPEHAEKQPKLNLVYQEKISKLKNNIELCEIRKQQISGKVKELVKKREVGDLSYPKYELLLNAYLKGKTLGYWNNYYDSLRLKLSNQLKKYELASSCEDYVKSSPDSKEIVHEKDKKDIHSKVDELSGKIEKLESLLVKESVKPVKPIRPKKPSFFELYEVTPSGKLVAFIFLLLLVTAPGFFLFKDDFSHFSQVVQENIIEDGLKVVDAAHEIMLSGGRGVKRHGSNVISKVSNPISRLLSISSPTGLAVSEVSSDTRENVNKIKLKEGVSETFNNVEIIDYITPCCEKRKVGKKSYRLTKSGSPGCSAMDCEAIITVGGAS
ncbi:MAG: hypothetical protein ISS23_00735 [Nanoarchaeota archaeon]|nr:hypothetical protein [Nanoarchaeota archaeon]